MKKALSIILSSAVVMLALFCGNVSAFAGETAEPIMLDSVPQVYIVTEDGSGLKLAKNDGYIDATVTITDTDGESIGGEAQVKVRGNTTARAEKKPYTVKFSKKLDVLGMGKAKKWALLANAFDPTLLRNYVALNTAQQLGLAYTSQQRVVEVWVDGVFRGCYNLVEPIQEGSTRVDIDIESNGGMCDFLIEREKDRLEDDAVYFTTNGIRFVCSEPDEPDEEQLAYIQSTMDDITDTLISGTRAEIEQKIDVESFARYCLLNEFVKTVDFDYSSVFFYYKDGKLYAGPAWDYDLSMGNIDENRTPGHYAAAQTDGLHCSRHLYQWLYEREWFFNEVRRVYLENQDYLDSVGADDGLIDYLHTTYARMLNHNFKVAKWNVAAYYKNLNKAPFSTYGQNADFFKSWCAGRAAWLKDYYTEDVVAYILGDSNSDGHVDVIDATVIEYTLAGLGAFGIGSAAADVNGNGSVDITDATDIQRYLAKFSSINDIDRQMYGKN